MLAAEQKIRKGRKSAKITAEIVGHCLPQDLIWSLVRELREFNVEDLVSMSAVRFGGRVNALEHYTVVACLRRLTRGGYLEKTVVGGSGNMECCTWKLIHDVGASAPRLNKDGQPSNRGVIRDQIWQTIKIISDFNCVELAASASTEKVAVPLGSARPYIRALYRTGYLMMIESPKSGKFARYRKVPGRCKGNAPLVLKSKEVFDRNLMQVISPIR